MTRMDFRSLAIELADLLKLQAVPIAITFTDTAPAGVPRYDAIMPPRTADGRTGRVPAGCVFWMKATERSFVTVPEDHGNCSVGSLTHGLKTLAEVARSGDVAELVRDHWVSQADLGAIPTVKARHAYLVYGPLAETSIDPDVVLLRINARQAMALSDALHPEIRFEGKPQCHVLAIAKELGQVAISVGCALSRVRTGMSNAEMTCAIPVTKLPHVIERVREGLAADSAVARYAAEDAVRFPA